MLNFGDCLEFMRGMVEKRERVDAIITDPPYLYLNHKLDRKFNEREFFELASQITDKIVFFGRGDSFYKWNLLCAEFGFEFKEEIIWDKTQISNPMGNLGRQHETISVRMKKGSSINKVYICPIKKALKEDKVEILINDLKRVFSSLKNSDNINRYLEKGDRILKSHKNKHCISKSEKLKEQDRDLNCINKYLRGTMLSSIMRESREHYKMEHPTQKPIELLRKLVLLISDKGDTICDPFMGSGSTGVASLIEGRKFIGCEIDSEYFEIAKRRVEETDKTLRQSLFYGID